jgi:hypothetical protein
LSRFTISSSREAAAGACAVAIPDAVMPMAPNNTAEATRRPIRNSAFMTGSRG